MGDGQDPNLTTRRGGVATRGCIYRPDAVKRQDTRFASRAFSSERRERLKDRLDREDAWDAPCSHIHPKADKSDFPVLPTPDLNTNRCILRRGWRITEGAEVGNPSPRGTGWRSRC